MTTLKPWPPGGPYPLLPDPAHTAAANIAMRFAKELDAALARALDGRGLSLVDAMPRLTRQVQGQGQVVLLDGEPLVRMHPLVVEADGPGGTVGASMRIETFGAAP